MYLVILWKSDGDAIPLNLHCQNIYVCSICIVPCAEFRSDDFLVVSPAIKPVC